MIIKFLVLTFLTSSLADSSDYLIFSQQWPITVCSEWKSRFPNQNCKYPDNNLTWTVKGLSSDSQENSSDYGFNIYDLDYMMDSLNQRWTNIEFQESCPYKHWEDQWNNNGKKAIEMGQQAFMSLRNYFKQGIKWQYKFDIVKAFQNKISPGYSYNLSFIESTIKESFEAKPQVICTEDKKTLLEIRLCFNDTLCLVDCSKLSNCDRIGIIYPKDEYKSNAKGDNKQLCSSGAYSVSVFASLLLTAYIVLKMF